jgi:hypothetical protein
LALGAEDGVALERGNWMEIPNSEGLYLLRVWHEDGDVWAYHMQRVRMMTPSKGGGFPESTPSPTPSCAAGGDDED